MATFSLEFGNIVADWISVNIVGLRLNRQPEIVFSRTISGAVAERQWVIDVPDELVMKSRWIGISIDDLEASSPATVWLNGQRLAVLESLPEQWDHPTITVTRENPLYVGSPVFPFLVGATVAVLLAFMLWK